MAGAAVVDPKQTRGARSRARSGSNLDNAYGFGGHRDFTGFIPEWNEVGALLREKCQSLAVQPRKLHHRPETFAVCKIEGHNFILGDAIEITVGTEAKSARPAKFGQVFGTKDAHKMSVRGIVFTDRRHGIGRSKWILASYDDVAIGRDCQVERTESWVTH